VIVANQVAADGSFPQELRRTKPYGYSLFNLEAMAMICQILSTREDNLWTLRWPTVVVCLAPWNSWFRTYATSRAGRTHRVSCMTGTGPCVRTVFWFAGLALEHPEYIELWKRLPPDSTVDEVIRNFLSGSQCFGYLVSLLFVKANGGTAEQGKQGISVTPRL